MSSRLTLAIVMFLALIVGASLSLANETARVLIVAPSSNDSTALRLRDELAVLGFDVVVVVADSSTASLSAAAHAAGASAAARVETWPPEILLWVGDGETSQDDTVRVSQSLQGKIESEMLALRAVELLRGRLLPVPIATGSASVPAASIDAPVASVLPTSSAVAPSLSSASEPYKKPDRKPVESTDLPAKPSVFLGPAMFVSPGGLSPSGHAALSARLPMVNRLSAEAWLFVPVTAGTVRNSDGEIALRPFFLGVGVDARLTAPENSFVMSIGAGAGPMLLWFAGQPEQMAHVGASGAQWAGLAYGRLGLGVRLHAKLRLRFDGLIGPVFPEPVLRIVGSEVAHVGRPVVFLTIGAELTP